MPKTDPDGAFFYGDMTLTVTDSELRTTRVTTWFTPAEAAIIDKKRGHYNRSSYLRAAALDKEIARAPSEVNREQWADLGGVRGDLIHIARHLNFAAREGGQAAAVRATLDKLDEANKALDQLRAWLIGGHLTTIKAG